MRQVAIGAVRTYQRTLGVVLPDRCKYYPSCSSYAIQAYREFGIVRGTILSCWRVLRCNPWSHGGVDHVHEQRLFGVRR